MLKCYNVYNVITILLKRYVVAIFVMLLQDWKLLEYYCKIAAILLEWSVWSSFDLQFLTHSCNVYVYVSSEALFRANRTFLEIAERECTPIEEFSWLLLDPFATHPRVPQVRESE